MELLCLQVVRGSFLLAVGVFLFMLEAFYLEWESASNKHLMGL